MNLLDIEKVITDKLSTRNSSISALLMTSSLLGLLILGGLMYKHKDKLFKKLPSENPVKP